MCFTRALREHKLAEAFKMRFEDVQSLVGVFDIKVNKWFQELFVKDIVKNDKIELLCYLYELLALSKFLIARRVKFSCDKKATE
jgi:hypothetical protein